MSTQYTIFSRTTGQVVLTGDVDLTDGLRLADMLYAYDTQVDPESGEERRTRALHDPDWAIVQGDWPGEEYRIVPHEDPHGSGWRPERLPPPAPATPTIAHVRAEAAGRIEQAMPRWMIDREVSGGKPVPEPIKAHAAAIRAASDRLEAMDPVPADFADDRWWPAPLQET